MGCRGGNCRAGSCAMRWLRLVFSYGLRGFARRAARGSMRDTVAATVFFDRMTGLQDFVDGVPGRELPRGIMCDAVAAEEFRTEARRHRGAGRGDSGSMQCRYCRSQASIGGDGGALGAMGVEYQGCSRAGAQARIGSREWTRIHAKLE